MSIFQASQILQFPHISAQAQCRSSHLPQRKTQFLVRRAADVAVGRRLKKQSLHEVNEHFSGKHNIAVSSHLSASTMPQFLPTAARDQFLVRRAADVAVGRRLKKRSLLEVNEHFSGKPNGADAPLSQEIIGESPYKPYRLDEPLIQS